jgi:DNA-binding NarL/FixJ family response regulator
MFEFDSDRQLKIVIADDHEVVRVGIRRLLSINKSFLIVDEASNGEEAIEMIKYHKPDIALLDIMMPKMDGIDTTHFIKLNIPDTLVVILTAFEDSAHLEKALEAGADGYLTKDISAKDLINAVLNVYKGERVFSKSIVNIIQNTNVREALSDPTQISISKREQEILNLLSLGKTSPEISEQLNISVRTVQTHRSNIIQKLGIKSASELIRYAVLKFG